MQPVVIESNLLECLVPGYISRNRSGKSVVVEKQHVQLRVSTQAFRDSAREHVVGEYKSPELRHPFKCLRDRAREIIVVQKHVVHTGQLSKVPRNSTPQVVVLLHVMRVVRLTYGQR